MIYQWINIIVLFSFLGIVLRKKLGAHFAEQRRTLDEKIKSASSEYEEIQKKYNEIQNSVRSLSTKISDLKNFSLKEIQNETHRIETDTARTIEKISTDGEARVKNEAERAKKGLEKELFHSALSSAKEALQKDFKAKNPEWVSQMVQSDAPPRERENYAS